MFGQTEINYIVGNCAPLWPARAGSMGRPYPGHRVAVIDDGTSARELADMHAAGIRGVRVNLESYGESDPAVAARHLQEAAARVAPLGWHVQTYTNLAILTALHDTILALPTTLVVDHFGRPQAARGVAQPGFDALLALLRSGKVYVKISAPYRISQQPHYTDAAPIARAMIGVTASDSPEFVGPQMACTLSALIISCVALTALVGSPWVSRVRTSIVRPFMPPAVLIAFAA